MKTRSLHYRTCVNWLMKALAILASCVGVWLFLWFLLELLRQGLPSWTWTFFSRVPTPPGIEGGGIVNALAGTAVMTLTAMLIGVPIGLLTGMYLAEFDRDSAFAGLVRFAVNMLNGIPAILIGLFVFLAVVAPTGHYSGYAGALALAMLVAPLVAGTSESSLRAVPESLREASVSIGASQWHTIVFLLSRAAGRDLLRGIARAVARVCGLTTPLLFSALNSSHMLENFSEPTGNLTVTIFQYGLSPYPDRNQITWGISLLIVVFVLLVNLGTTVFTQEKTPR